MKGDIMKKNRLAMCAVVAACALPLGMRTAMAAPTTSPSDTKVEYCEPTQVFKFEAEIHARLLKIGLHHLDADRITIKISHEISYNKTISPNRIRELAKDDVTPAQKDKLAGVISDLPGHRIARVIADHNKKVLDDIDKVIIDKLVSNGVDERTAQIVAPHVTIEIISKHSWNVDTVKDGLDKGFDEAAKHNAEVGDKAAEAMKGMDFSCNPVPSSDPSGSASPSKTATPSADPSKTATPTPSPDPSGSATVTPKPTDPSVTPTAPDSPEPSESADDDNTGDEGVLPVAPSTNPSKNTGDEGVVTGPATPSANPPANAAPAGGDSEAKALPKTGN